MMLADKKRRDSSFAQDVPWNPRRYFHFLLEERGGALNSIPLPFRSRTFFPLLREDETLSFPLPFAAIFLPDWSR